MCSDGGWNFSQLPRHNNYAITFLSNGSAKLNSGISAYLGFALGNVSLEEVHYEQDSR